MKKIIGLSVLFFVLGVQMVVAQAKQITGKVTSKEDGLGIPGVSVVIKGTTVGTVTTIEGDYSIQANSKDVLVFSFVGMKMQEIAIGARTVVNVEMEAETIGMEEVVVTAYGSKGKVGLKGAVTSVQSDELEQVPMATFDQALQGKTTGVYISSGSGQPGSGDTKVRIRGNASITGNNAPLYVMDGVPIEPSVFASLNVNDFESISVLKDASASSIYGSRAGNGVILITTKRGKAGETKFNYRFQNGWTSRTRDKFDMMNSTEKLAFEELAMRGEGWRLSPMNPANAGLSEAQLAANEGELNRLRNTNTDWRDVFTRTGQTQSHEINMSGGNDKTKFYFALQRFEQEGQAIRSDLERTAGRMNLDHKINDKLRFGLSTSMGYTTSSMIESEGGIALANPFAAAYLANPYENPYDEKGNIVTGGGRTGSNALDRLLNSSNNKAETKGVGAMHLEYDLIKGLTIKSQVGIDYRMTTYERWLDPNSYAGQQVSNGEQGSISENFARRSEMNFTNTADYKTEIGEKHVIGALVGSELIKRKYDGFGYTGYGLNGKLPETPAAVTPGSPDNNFIPNVSGYKSERNLFSIFSILNYTYDSKYSFYGSLRRDGSSAFGENNKYAVLYSLGFTWNMAEEAFMSNLGWVNNLKLRASYGTTGNQEGIGSYESQTLYGAGSYNGQPSMGLTHAGDPDIKWEIGKKLNIGIDYNLFNNRISGSVEFYNDITSDLFIVQSLSSWAGVPGDSKSVNAGKMRNRGVEFLFSADVMRTKDFTWSVGANLSYNDNEILSLGQVDEFEQGTSIVKVGLPLGSHYIVKWAGVDPTTGNPMYYTKDGQLTDTYRSSDAVTDFGTSEPPFIGGFNTKLSYKGIELSANFSFAHGYKRFNNQSFFQENPNFAQFNLSTEMNTIWQKPGDITEIQRLGTEREFSSKDIEDASFLRFRNLMIAYTLPKSLLQNQKVIDNVRIYAQGQNLYTWTSYTGFDPEDSDNIAKYEYPSSRFFTVGVDVAF
ncbi:TonB-dependent receptor [Marinifilum fragile]|uniref:SusC/RagA family TonB-linked outer membrane protein n=1 Tax=Marinifilum fragile TaxID=570161 RepID=UPI002AA61475|nr:TonB-dependent receptor [Marinifilum fragile]